jgi:DNA-binding MarR family transcriptional regulator
MSSRTLRLGDPAKAGLGRLAVKVRLAIQCYNTYITAMPNLREELKQQKPFKSLQEEAALSVVRTSARLIDTFEQLFKPYAITGTQYNVLRILRGSEPNGLCRNEIRDRMVTRMPDVTRLLDRMDAAGLIARARVDDDRRMVRTRITAKGRRLVDELDDVVIQEHQRAFAALSREQLRSLIEHLSAVRERI